MEEKVLVGKKNGLAVMLVTILLYLVALGAIIAGGLMADAGMVAGLVLLLVGVVYVCLGWIVVPGLKVLGPQEALVLTLFGKYVGTLKGEGFYFVNPFCTAVNPAAKTKLNQSGDVKSVATAAVSANG